MLQDDPNFLPDFDLVPVELDRMDFAMGLDDTQRSVLSPCASQHTQDEERDSQQEIGGLIIPPSASSMFVGQTGGFGTFSNVSGGVAPGDQEAVLFDDDLGLVIDDDGGAVFGETPIRDPVTANDRREPPPMGAASSRVPRQIAGDQVDEQMAR